ncbi:MAG: phosphohydrolase [Fimbriimonadales bacterium]|nr:MAG: phosphohydrolase [Fimbriimonadales bacterium]
MEGYEKAEKVLETLQRLPAMSAPVLKVIQLAGDPDASAEELADSIRSEPTLTADVLRVANSAYYGVPGQVTTVRTGVILLGMATIRSLAMMAAAHTWLDQPELHGRRGRELWDHLLTTALYASELARRYAPAFQEEAFCCGLLHDLGKIALLTALGKQYDNTLAAAAQRRMPDVAAERMAFGFDHEAIGLALARKWKLPEMLCDVIGFHHDPRHAEHKRDFVEFVHAADHLYWKQALGENFAPERWPVEEEVAFKFELNDPTWLQYLGEAVEKTKKEFLSALMAA